MKKTGVLLLLLLLFFNYAPASAYDVVTNTLTQVGDGEIHYTTTASVELAQVEKAEKQLGLEKTGRHRYRSDRYCEKMTLQLKQSGGHLFLTAQCPCYACYEKVRYDFGCLGKSQATLNGQVMSSRDTAGLLLDYGFTEKYKSVGNVACISGALDSAQIPSVRGGIKGTIAKNQNQILVGIPVIDVLY